MGKKGELDVESLAQQVKELTAKVEALENGTKQKKKKSDTPRKPSAYALFIKEKYSEVKKENPDATMGEISKIISKMWKEKDN
jgi:hypothetical protein